MSRKVTGQIGAVVLLFLLYACSSSPSDDLQNEAENANLNMLPTQAPKAEVEYTRPSYTSTPFPTETPTISIPTDAPTDIPATKTSRPTNTPEPPTSTPTPDIPPGDPASVINITDGDTIDVLVDGVQQTVRYIGIDTPERGEPLADECTAANASLVAGEDVILVKDTSETDRYGRLLRYVFLEDGTFVNKELVRNGYAVAVSYPPDTQYDNQFNAEESIAQASNAGIWGLPTSTPIPPTRTPLPTWTPAPLPTWTPAPLPTWTPPPVPTNTPVPQPTQPPPPAPAYVQITYIFYDGVVPRVESDEFAEIGNLGNAAGCTRMRSIPRVAVSVTATVKRSGTTAVNVVICMMLVGLRYRHTAINNHSKETLALNRFWVSRDDIFLKGFVP